MKETQKRRWKSEINKKKKPTTRREHVVMVWLSTLFFDTLFCQALKKRSASKSDDDNVDVCVKTLCCWKICNCSNALPFEIYWKSIWRCRTRLLPFFHHPLFFFFCSFFVLFAFCFLFSFFHMNSCSGRRYELVFGTRAEYAHPKTKWKYSRLVCCFAEYSQPFFFDSILRPASTICPSHEHFFFAAFIYSNFSFLYIFWSLTNICLFCV